MIGLTSTYYKTEEAIEEAHKKSNHSGSQAIIQGGQGAGKNWAIAIILLKLAAERKRTITIVTDTFENLKDGAIKDFRDIFELQGNNFDNYYNKSDKDLKWGPSIIQFRYVAGYKPEAGKSKRRDILYVNETSKVAYSAIEHYIARTDELCLYDLNPDMESWVHTEIETLDKSVKIIVTHWDNEFCPAGERDFIESRKHLTEWYRVYGLGLTGTYSDRRIYQFTVVDELPEGIKRIPSGMDFGVSPDPTCLVDEYIDGANLYLDERFQENNLLPTCITGAERMCISDKLDEIDFNKNWMIGCDISGASEIKDLRKHGYNAKGVKKPTGSLIAGIKLMKSYNIIVTKRSVNLIKALEKWFWKIDHNGKIIPEPKGHEPDTLAASRYGLMLHKSKPVRTMTRSGL